MNRRPGVLHPIRLLHTALARAAAHHPEKLAIVAGERRINYGELAEQALSFAGALLECGMSRGERVAVYTGNAWECAAAIYGTLAAGGAFVVINEQTKAPKLSQILQDSGAAFLVVDTALESRAATALSKGHPVRAVFLSGRRQHDGVAFEATGAAVRSFTTAIERSFAPRRLPVVNPLDLAALIYTSGSTGEPKGVMMSHQSMLFAAESIAEYLRMGEDERIINFLPLSFDYGLYQLLMTIRLGATLVLERSFTFPSSIIRAVKEHAVTVFPGVPTVYTILVSLFRKKPFSLPTVERITNTAAALSDHLIPELRQIFPKALVFKMYGLTECKRVSYLEPEDLDRKPGSVGKAIPGTEMFLLSEHGTPVPPGEVGILHVRGPHVMLGYWNKPERTAEMLRPGRYPYERVLCTGDWFQMDDEGYFYFHGRRDDIIKSRGEKVSPVEVENTIRRMPEVEDVAVVGVPDTVLGEAVAAFMVKRPSASLTARQVQRHCAEHLEGFMVPSRIVFLEELPKTESGKVKKTGLVVPE